MRGVRVKRWWWVLTALAILSGAPAPAAPGLPAPSGQLILFPDSPYDPRMAPLQRHLRARVEAGDGVPVVLGDQILGSFGSDPGAWRQASALVRASLWFMLGRQALEERDSQGALEAFRRTRSVLETSELLARPPLLASIALLSGHLYFEQGELTAAEEAFRTAAVIDPDDLGEQLPEGPARLSYRAARRWVQDAPRIPVRIVASGNPVVLFLNGARVQGEGPSWLLELPPGRHLASATGERLLPAAAGFRLAPGEPRLEVQLRLEPGTGSALAQRPFSLAEAAGVIDRIREKLRERGEPLGFVGAVSGPAEGAEPERPDPRIGIRAGTRVIPGPDAADESPLPGPVRIELFRLEATGRIRFLGEGQVGA